MRLLVTGFGPFPTMPRNPSAALARTVAASPRWRILGVDAEARVLTTAYAALGRELNPALATEPDAVLMLGVAGRSRQVRVEIRATSRRSTLFPDAAGEVAARAARGRRAERHTAVRPVEALRLLRRQAVPARISRDAGRYLCNAAYYRALADPIPVLFVHVPKPPRAHRRRAGRRQRRPWAERVGAALVDIALIMVRDARRVCRTPEPALEG